MTDSKNASFDPDCEICNGNWTIESAIQKFTEDEDGKEVIEGFIHLKQLHRKVFDKMMELSN